MSLLHSIGVVIEITKHCKLNLHFSIRLCEIYVCMRVGQHTQSNVAYVLASSLNKDLCIYIYIYIYIPCPTILSGEHSQY